LPFGHLAQDEVMSRRSFPLLSAPRHAVRALAIVLVAGAVPAGVLASQRLLAPTPDMPGRIVYSRADQGVWDLFTSNPNGAAEARLTNTKDSEMNRSAAGEQQPRWSPDGQELAFTTYDRNGETSTIFRVPFAGGTPTPVVLNDKGWGDPAWQRPGGGCIVYSGQRAGGAERATDLFVQCPGQPAKALVESGDLDEAGPDWSPDGSQIVYEARESGQENIDNKQLDLWVVNADGSDPHVLLDLPDTSERHARWSPDGKTIAFVSYAYKAGLGKGILMTVDLSSPTMPISSHIEGAAGPAAWSPDGRSLLFYNTWDLGPKPMLAAEPRQEQVKGLYMLDPETHDITRLLPPAGGEQASGTSFEWGYAPDWTAGTYTPTPIATITPTPSSTPTASVTPSATSTREEATPTSPSPPTIYLPATYKDAPTTG
jgi:Tol biopolymer transport system component